eukprot:8110758-Lingulodinium_polyedra.AAC.1
MATSTAAPMAALMARPAVAPMAAPAVAFAVSATPTAKRIVGSMVTVIVAPTTPFAVAHHRQ